VSAVARGGRGRLVVFEGAEGVGKTTQIARLGDRLGAAGITYDRFREPGGTPLGDEIRSLLLSPASTDIRPRAEALLFMAARAQLMARVTARLAAGSVVLLDRFFLSTYAYQIVGRGLPPGPVRQANALAVGDVVPDLTLLLACDLDVSRARIVARGDLDRMEQEDDAFHARVTSAFLAAADPAWQAAHPEVGPVERIDGVGDVDTVGRRIDGALAARWPETFGPLGESQ
jgi:dTMP kinase